MNQQNETLQDLILDAIKRHADIAVLAYKRSWPNIHSFILIPLAAFAAFMEKGLTWFFSEKPSVC